MEPDPWRSLGRESPVVIIVRFLSLTALRGDHLGVIAQGTRNELAMNNLAVHQRTENLLNVLNPLVKEIGRWES